MSEQKPQQQRPLEAAMNEMTRWSKFETEKRAIAKKRLSPAKKQQAIAALKKRLGM